MHVDDSTYKVGDKTYRRALIRESYREKGKVKKRTISNISKCSDEEIEAIKLALKYKKDLRILKKMIDSEFVSFKSVGDVKALLRVASAVGIVKALGGSEDSKLILWLVLARLINQGSRLSAVRLVNITAACEVLGLDSFNEDDLYRAMDWLYENRDSIEADLFRLWKELKPEKSTSTLYLYDVSSSYVEGECNELATWGYNRDGKKGKKQVVYGLLTDEEGNPISIEVFRGNTRDPKTVKNQIDKLKKRFECDHVVLVGDKGMIRSPQISELNEAGFNYITSITKAEIRTLLNIEVLQLELFDVEVGEVCDEESGIRYILRRNPYRVGEIARSKNSKIDALTGKAAKANQYLMKHSRAKVKTQIKNIQAFIKKLRMEKYITVVPDESARSLSLTVDREKLEDDGKLDGCYVIKTDLPPIAGDAKTIHDRYKDLAKVEKAFRTMKGSSLDVRPIFVRRADRTRAHFLIVMLSYKIELYLRKHWADLNITVSEGIRMLSTVSSLLVTIGSQKLIKVAKPNEKCRELLDRIDVILPEVLPYRPVNVVTRKKLQKSRKN